MTRQDYLDGVVTHAQYYSAIAAEAGIGADDFDMLPLVRKALANGDEHLNRSTVGFGLHGWDALALGARRRIEPVLKAHGDGWSLAGGVCTMKQAAKNAALAQEARP